MPRQKVRVGHVDCRGRSSEVQRFTVQRAEGFWDLEEIVINLSTDVREGEGEKRELQVHEV